MLPGSVAKTNLGIFMGILGGWIIYYEPFGGMLPVVTWAIAVVAFLAHGWGCYNYVTGKGHTELLALIGLIPLGIFLSGVIPGYRAPDGCIMLVPLGLLILAILPDHRVQAPANPQPVNYHQQNSRYAPPPPEPKNSGVVSTMIAIFVIAALAIIGSIAYRSGYLNLRTQTVEDAQRLAVQQYPALSVADSPLNREFRSRYRHYQATNPAYFNDKQWPLHLAAESQAALDQGHAGR